MTPAQKREKNDVSFALNELYSYFMKKERNTEKQKKILATFLFLNQL